MSWKESWVICGYPLWVPSTLPCLQIIKPNSDSLSYAGFIFHFFHPSLTNLFRTMQIEWFGRWCFSNGSRAENQIRSTVIGKETEIVADIFVAHLFDMVETSIYIHTYVQFIMRMVPIRIGLLLNLAIHGDKISLASIRICNFLFWITECVQHLVTMRSFCCSCHALQHFKVIIIPLIFKTKLKPSLI